MKLRRAFFPTVTALLAVAALLVAFPAVSSASLVINKANGTPYVVDPSLTGFSTFGDQMGGMLVTAYFGADFVSGAWVNGAGGAGGVTVGGAFSLTESGDTFSSDWTLTNLSNNNLTRLVLFGPPGKTVFDTCLNPPCASDSSGGTPGSERGWTLEPTGGTYGGDITVLFTDIVSIIGNPPVGDLYATMDITFPSAAGALGGIQGGGTLTFIQDTDSVPEGGSITPSVPEPSSLILLGSGVLLAAFALRRKK